jgi:CRISPR-associated protein Cst2
MSAEAARTEASEAASAEPATGRRVRARGRTLARRSRFEVSRAISLSPWTGDVVFNVAGIGATPSASRSGRDPVPYSGEVHATRYQYGFALTPDDLFDKRRAVAVVDAIVDLAEVAGSHARYFYDFSPDTIIFRWTDDPAPRLLYPFRADDDGRLSVPDVLRRVRAGDIEPDELIVGGSLATMPDGEQFRGLGVRLHDGVKAAAEDARTRLRQHLGL